MITNDWTIPISFKNSQILTKMQKNLNSNPTGWRWADHEKNSPPSQSTNDRTHSSPLWSIIAREQFPHILKRSLASLNSSPEPLAHSSPRRAFLHLLCLGRPTGGGKDESKCRRALYNWHMKFKEVFSLASSSLGICPSRLSVYPGEQKISPRTPARARALYFPSLGERWHFGAARAQADNRKYARGI